MRAVQTNLRSIPCTGRRFFSKSNRPALRPTQPCPIQQIRRYLSPKCKADNSPPHTGDVKNASSYTCALPYAFTACAQERLLPFYLYLDQHAQLRLKFPVVKRQAVWTSATNLSEEPVPLPSIQDGHETFPPKRLYLHTTLHGVTIPDHLTTIRTVSLKYVRYNNDDASFQFNLVYRTGNTHSVSREIWHRQYCCPTLPILTSDDHSFIPGPFLSHHFYMLQFFQPVSLQL